MLIVYNYPSELGRIPLTRRRAPSIGRLSLGDILRESEGYLYYYMVAKEINA